MCSDPVLQIRGESDVGSLGSTVDQHICIEHCASPEPQMGGLTSPFNLPAPGRRQPLYVVFDLAENCVFVKQSPYALHCGPLTWALLLPKLRSQFAEFRNELSLERLWTFSSSTCVGFGLGSLCSP